MTERANFLLGNGHKLAAKVPFLSHGGTSKAPYKLTEQIAHLAPQVKSTAAAMQELPKEACPEDQAVSVMALHPQYYARSAFPERLLNDLNLRLIGSKPIRVRPRAGRGAESATGAASTAMFVAGKRRRFEEFAAMLKTLPDSSPIASDLLKLERIGPLRTADRLMGQLGSKRSPLEIIVHFNTDFDRGWEEAFLDYAKQAGIDVDSEHDYLARGLWFLPGAGTEAAAERLARFAFVRAIRPMPKLRPIVGPTALRSATTPQSSLPAQGPIDPDCKVAVFDGGLLDGHLFANWVKEIHPDPGAGIGDPVPLYQQHGTAVTSAVLFGHLEPGLQPRPYCSVDHYRVLGDKTNDASLYQVMLYIDRILSQRSYQLASISIGPDEVAGDDQVTAWTAMLDEQFAEGETLAAIAVGNNGAEKPPRNRILVPSDCVNALAVGACTGLNGSWKRASYSAIGPGRAPGLIKPDVVQFGGVVGNEFRFAFPKGQIVQMSGTSFSAPAVARIAAGLRAHFGSVLTPLTIRALIIHGADQGGNDYSEVGFGLVPNDLAELVTCDDTEVRVLYQGKLEPGKVLRAPIPLPVRTIEGRVQLRATFCYACSTDPNAPGDYTRAGLTVTFRPHSKRFDKDPKYPKSWSFFGKTDFAKEQDLRNDAHKWDTVMHREHGKDGGSLNDPVFDIHYQTRQPGLAGQPPSSTKLSYALVVTVNASGESDLYERVRRRYQSRLSPIEPRIGLPVRIRA